MSAMSEKPEEQYEEPKIYLLPNLMTAGNLCCGFFAVLTIFKGMQHSDFSEAYRFYQQAIMLIFGSCIFDLLDGRLARLGGQESPFGQEFDSIADVVSFGMAPALLVSKAVLFPLSEQLGDFKLGWAIAFIYLLCGAMRLARFNCLANMPKRPGDNLDFRGIPIPMAAGFIASITFLIIHLYNDPSKTDPNLGAWNYVLAATMLGLSALMLSNVRYPSFKKVDWRTKGSLWGVVIGAMFFMLLLNEQTRWYTPTLIFTLYLLYGLIRPFLSKRMQKTLEEKVEG
ncbi:CDP-diacylglycerol--serine O-phosphatidyltransferase [Rubritalea tangerina]|uniref:CDP-diacylglycerol--serine O-phosphatidyltransferase n=3 Tax=Rubritalea tangerina TaxID=430798 RepID=A0ABW4ZEE6_9BACT